MPLAVARPTVSGSQAGYIPVEPGQQAVRVETKGRKRAFEVAAGQVVYRLVAVGVGLVVAWNLEAPHFGQKAMPGFNSVWQFEQ